MSPAHCAIALASLRVMATHGDAAEARRKTRLRRYCQDEKPAHAPKQAHE